jgi:acyl-coenzyme A synthetase/AMP-(fatty) acid ligase
MMELAAAYGFFDELHLPLAFGGTVIVHPQGYMNPLITKAIGYYRMNIIFTGPPLVDILSKLPPESQPDLSSLKLCAVGGGYLSEERKKKFNDYIKERGGNIRVTNGYGLTEAGAACILSDPERDDDAIGFPMPGISVKIFDEDEKKFYSIEDGPRTGGLYIACDTISSGRIGDKVFFETEEIDGRPYLCTFDLVRVNEDGSLTSMGRMNRFFVNDEGVRFESGIVENAMAARSGISECAVLPEYSKAVHDTVPVLYVKTQASGITGLRKVREAVRHLFINDDHISSMNLPEAVVVAEEIPYNANGKVDVHEILKGSVKGDRYLIKPIYRRGKLTDILLVPPDKNKAGFGAVKMMEEFTKKEKREKK